MAVVGLVAVSLGGSVLAFIGSPDPLVDHIRESFVRLVWVDGEGNIPSWFSAALLLVAALLLATIGFAEKKRGGAGQARHWLVLSSVFGLLSVDETAQLHERSIVPLRDQFGASGFLHFTWIVPAGICVSLFALAYLRFLSRLPVATRRLLLLAAAVFLTGALGIEAISGKQASLHGEQNFTYHLIVTLEELLEMAGIVIFLYALLDYIRRRFSRISFQIIGR